MSKHSFWVVWLALGTLLALLLSCSGASASPDASGTPVKGPRIALAETSFDFGKVPLDKVVSKTFKVKNVGSAPLVILGTPAVRAVQGC